MSLKPEDAARPSLSPKDPWFPAERPPGAFPPSPRPDNNAQPEAPQSLSAAVLARKSEYVHKRSVKVKVGTWNVASMSGAEKDLGGWFAQGLGIKGLAQDLSGVDANGNSSAADSSDDEEVESVQDQERRHRTKNRTLPENDSAAVSSDDDVGLYVLGLQEIIDVSSVTETMRPYTDPNPARKWKRALKRTLPLGYKKVVEQQLLGLLLLVYAAPDLAAQVSSVDSTSVGTGLLGYMGNKGAVSGRIVLGEATRLLFVNCHLAAGADQTALTRRLWDTSQILSRTKFAPVVVDGESGSPESIGDEDFALWFGDLNYRLDGIPGEDVRRLLLLHARNEYDVVNKSRRKIDSELGYINASNTELAPPSQFEIDDEEADRSATESSAEPPLDPKSDPASLHTTIHSLLAHDQLHAQQKLGRAFHDGWREGEINFLPTYKYDVGSVGMFDSGEKKRSPSWCDRILYRTKRDRELYVERTKMEAQAKKKDEEMRKRGIETEAAQEDVSFNYDPETDGGNYFEDADELEDEIHDVELIQTREAFEDPVEVESYVSHQRVLSSDHKPLTAVFKLTYDAVIPELKAKIHQEVAREFDKAENEGRPNVTVVLDHSSDHSSTADQSSDPTELKIVDFGDIRYDVPKYRSLTIANTGQTVVSFAFIDRPGDVSEAKIGPTPAWLDVHVDLDAESSKVGPEDLGSSTRYQILPGDTTSIELKLCVTDFELTHKLNSGEVFLDDILVLRISNGRDHFIPIKGTWLQTCFCRTLDELVRIPSGVRNLSVKGSNVEAQLQPSGTAHHSAPQELFALTEAIPGLVERVAAEWDMLRDNEPAPWKQNGNSWPFGRASSDREQQNTHQQQLEAIREALDTATPLDPCLDVATPSLARLELLSETLISFLASLRDGIIPAAIWNEVDTKITTLEKAKSMPDEDAIQEIVMEALSSAPIHSVSFTFVTFMLTRVITEIAANVIESQSSPKQSTRSRSSTTVSEALSEVSLSSEQSSKPKRSFLPSLTRRTTNASSSPTAPTAPPTLQDQKRQLGRSYAEVFAPLIIKSDDDMKMKSKEKKTITARKQRVLEAFLTS